MMKEYLKEMRPCPFCGVNNTTHTWIDPIREDEEGDPRYCLYHYCTPGNLTTVVSIYGSSVEECIERWNANGEKHNADH